MICFELLSASTSDTSDEIEVKQSSVESFEEKENLTFSFDAEDGQNKKVEVELSASFRLMKMNRIT